MGCKSSKPLESIGSNAGVSNAQRPMTKRLAEEFEQTPTASTKVSLSSAACLPESDGTNALSKLSNQDETLTAQPGETTERELDEDDLNEAADEGVEVFRPCSPDDFLQQRAATAKRAPTRQQREVEFEAPPAEVSPTSAPSSLPENNDMDALFEIPAHGEKPVAQPDDNATELGGDDDDTISNEETATTVSLPDMPDENEVEVDAPAKVLDLDPCSLDEFQLQKEATAMSTHHIVIHDEDSVEPQQTETKKDHDFISAIVKEPTAEMPHDDDSLALQPTETKKDHDFIATAEMSAIITPPVSPASTKEAEPPSSVNSFSTDKQEPICLYELTASTISPARSASSGSISIGNNDGEEPLLHSPEPSPQRNCKARASTHLFTNSPAALQEPAPFLGSGSDLDVESVSSTPAAEQQGFLTTPALKEPCPDADLGSIWKITQSAANSFNAFKQLRPFEAKGSHFRTVATNFFGSLNALCPSMKMCAASSLAALKQLGPFECQGGFSAMRTSVASCFDAFKQLGTFKDRVCCETISLKQHISFNHRGFLPTRNKFNFVPLVCALVTFMLHAATIFNGEFVWDDRAAVLSNADVLGQGSLLDLLRNDFWGQDLTLEKSHKSWRPAAVLSLRWSQNLHGPDARGFHFHNVLLHALVTYLFSAFCFQLITGYLGKGAKIARTAAILSSLMFAVNPIHTEPVASIVGRSDLLCGLFFVAAMTMYRVGQKESSPRYLAAAHVAGALSTLSKEVGVTAFGVFAASEGIFHLTARSASSRSFVRNAVVSITCAIILTALHLSLHGEVKIYNWTILENSISLMESRYSRMLSYSHVAALYLWKMMFPFGGLSYDWGWPCIGHVESIFDLRNVGTLVAFMSMFAICVNAFKARHAIILWAVALVVIPFVPASNLFFPVGTILAERLLYIPSMGFSLGGGYSMAHLLSKSSSKGAACCRVLIAAFIALMSLKTLHRCAEWTTEARLFESALQVCPSSLKVLNNYARLHLETDPRRAVQYLDEATRLHGDYATAHFNKGLALSNLGKTAAALSSFKKVLDLEPTNGRVRPLLAGAMVSHAKLSANVTESEQHMAIAMGLVDESIRHFDSKNPRALHLRCELGHALGFDAEENLRHCEAALDANREPSSDRIDEDVTLNVAGIISKEMGEYDAAIRYFSEGLKKNAKSYDILLNLASLHSDMNNYELAAAYFERAEDLDIRDSMLKAFLLANKGWLREKQGLRLAAREHYSEAVGLTQPNPHPQIVANLNNIDVYCRSNKCE